MIVFVQKAFDPRVVGRKKWKNTRTYARTNALANAMARATKVDLFNGITRFKKRIDKEEVYQAWLSRDWSRISTRIPWDKLPEDLAPAVNQIRRSLADSSSINLGSVGRRVDRELRFDVNNPRIERFLQKRTGEMVVGIKRDAEEIIQGTVTGAFTQALDPRRIADRIKGSIGLYPRLETALENYRAALEKKGMTPKEVDRLGNAYEQRLLDYRAVMIARTETRNATNYGQLFVWQDAASQGLINPEKAKKVWIVDGAPCPICEPMDGKEVGLAEAWVLNNGDVVDVPSESHPNCLCGMTLNFGE